MIDGGIVIAWLREETGRIALRRSVNGGTTFAPEQLLAILFQPIRLMLCMASSGSRLYVMWIDAAAFEGEQLFMRASMDAGATFGDTQKLTSLSGEVIWPFHEISADSSDAYVAWASAALSNSDILFRKSNDGGVVWIPSLGNPAENVSDTMGFSLSPKIAIGANAYLVWLDSTHDTLPAYDIFFRSVSR